MAPVMKSHKTNSLEAQRSFDLTPRSALQAEPTTIKSHSNTAQGSTTHAPTISHEDEKTALILFITGGFTVWFLF